MLKNRQLFLLSLCFILTGCFGNNPRLEVLQNDASFDDALFFSNGNNLIGIDPETREQTIHIRFPEPVLYGCTIDGFIYCVSTETVEGSSEPVLYQINEKGKIVLSAPAAEGVYAVFPAGKNIIMAAYSEDPDKDGWRSKIEMYKTEEERSVQIISSTEKLLLVNENSLEFQGQYLLPISIFSVVIDNSLIHLNTETWEREMDETLFPDRNDYPYTAMISRHKIIIVNHNANEAVIRNVSGGRVLGTLPLYDMFPEFDFSAAGKTWRYQLTETEKTAVLFFTCSNGNSEQGMLVMNKITLEPVATIPYRGLEDLNGYELIGSYKDEIILYGGGKLLVLNAITGQVAYRGEYPAMP